MDLVDLIKKAVIEASTTFRDDQLDAYNRAIKLETNDNAKWVMELLLENARIAKANKFPLCDDTGIPHVLIEVGKCAQLPWWFLSRILQRE